MDSVYRAACRTQVTKLCNTVADYLKTFEQIPFRDASDPSAVEADVALLLQRLKNAHSNLKKADDAMRSQIKPEDLTKECENIIEYDDKAVTLIAQLEYARDTLLKRTSMPQNTGGANVSTGGANESMNNASGFGASGYSGVKLKSFELKKFDDNFENWLPFWEQYKQAVHENNSLSPAAKFNFLSSALVGKAAAGISGFTPSERCYSQAIDLLLEEYGNVDKIVEKYLQKLINLKQVQSNNDFKGLRTLYNDVTATMRSLTALEISPSKYDLIIKSVLLKAIPSNLRVEYHRSVAKESSVAGNTNEGHLKELLTFIKSELEAMEKSQLSEREKRTDDNASKRPIVGSAATLKTTAQTEYQCVLCKQTNHATKNCSSNLSIEQKKAVLKREGRCFRCANKNHNSKFCKAQWLKCERCSGRHLTTLCERPRIDKREENEAENSTGSSERKSERQTTTSATNKPAATLNTMHEGQVEIYLQTAKAVVCDGNDSDRVLARLIMDNGSQRTYVSEQLAKELEVKSNGSEKLNIVVFGQRRKKQAVDFQCVELKIRSQYNNKSVNIIAIVVPTICADVLPVPKLEGSKYKHIQQTLAESQFSGERVLNGINILIGQDYYWQFNTNETEIISENLVAVNTFFGWTIQGRALEREKEKIKCVLSLMEITEDFSDVSKFWSLESIGILNDKAGGERETIDETVANILQTNGRYVVSLPWRISSETLNNNKVTATGRLRGLTMKLLKHKNEMLKYDNAIRDLVNDGIAEIAPAKSNRPVYYMPHRAVYRDDSATTKMRIVFDASSSEPGMLSLNDHLSAGDNIVADLLKTLIRFRTHSAALVADIEKAFLQITVAHEDRDVHRFLWYETIPTANAPLPEIKEFRMTRVTFGVASSPFLLSATINKHLKANESAFGDTVALLKNSFYVDDLVLSVANPAVALKIFEDSNKIMSSAKFNLRKWNTNSIDVKNYFSTELSAPTTSHKVLGVNWCTLTDEMSVNVASITEYLRSLRGSKRDVMKAMARIYDPLGLLGPFTVRLKILLQRVWIANIDWDQCLSGDMHSEFQTWQDELAILNNFSAKRCFSPLVNAQNELHIFADASPKAYGAVAYWRQVTLEGTVSTNLICSKNRISPITKTTSNSELTLPKLELTAALVGARLGKFLSASIELKVDEIYFWTDSMITLNWINGQGKKVQPYVKARVAEITQLTNIYQWRHCDGQSNPADLLTRGVKAEVLMDSSLWRHGPTWLSETGLNCGSPCNSFAEVSATLLTSTEPSIVAHKEVMAIEDFSCSKRLLRVTAFIFRFIGNLRNASRLCPRRPKGIADVPSISYQELRNAENYWIKRTQCAYYANEIGALLKGGSVSSCSKIISLNPTLTDGVLRLRGRLPSTYFGKNDYNPVILPKRSHFSRLIILEAHQSTLHGGISTVLCQVRKRYWIVQGRQLIKSILQRCVTCKRLHGKSASEPWTVLPVERVTTSKPFETSGVDFAGPLFVKTDDGLRQRKVYIMLFTCAAIRAVHLELVGDMTTNSCVQAIRRFIARRGVPTTVISDNAKTFKRADLELRKLETLLKRNEVQQLAAHQGITWKYIPERAAWWGGFWERMVRSVKDCIKAALGKALVNFEELATVLAEIESVVNARPLTYITGDHNDLEPLTPAHFLTNPKTIFLQANFRSDGTSLAKSWESRQVLMKRYLKRWQQEYLTQLRAIHHNKSQPSRGVKVGDVVLLHEDNKSRLQWRLAVVQTTYQGRDGRVRACDVQLNNQQVLKRPIQLLYPLEVSSSIPRAEDVEN